MSPDDICEEFSKYKLNLNINCDKEEGIIIIRGSAKTLEFIGKLILAQAEFEKDDGFQIIPNGAGKKFFNKKSELGIYIKRDD